MRIYVPPTDDQPDFDLSEVAAIVAKVSEESYEGNIKIESSRQISKTSVRVTLTVINPRGKGARRSASDLPLTAACWHVFRDVIKAVYEAHPDARVNTGTARYVSAEHFRVSGDATGTLPVGSADHRIPVAAACECERNQSA